MRLVLQSGRNILSVGSVSALLPFIDVVLEARCLEEAPEGETILVVPQAPMWICSSWHKINCHRQSGCFIPRRGQQSRSSSYSRTL